MELFSSFVSLKVTISINLLEIKNISVLGGEMVE